MVLNNRKSSDHPSVEQWSQWLTSGASEPLTNHLVSCASCTEEVELLRALRECVSVPLPGVVQRIPSDLVQRQPSRVPPLPMGKRRVAWRPKDIRGVDFAIESGPRMLNLSDPEAEVSIRVSPPTADVMWTFEGSIWLTTDAPDPTINLVLLLGDHVLELATARDGEEFVIRQVVGAGWTLEIHLPSGKSLVLEDPLGDGPSEADPPPA